MGLYWEIKDRKWESVWLIVVLTFLLLWPTKWPQYTLMLTPALAMVAGNSVLRAVTWIRPKEDYWNYLEEMLPYPPRITWWILAIFVSGLLLGKVVYEYQLAYARRGWETLNSRNSPLLSDFINDINTQKEGVIAIASREGLQLWDSGLLAPIWGKEPKIINANKYTDVLRYNRTLLQFVEPIFMNTASSSASIDTRFRLNQDGNLEINIKRQSEENFLASDTLVILKFTTFLGNAKHTSIDFTDSKFSNRNCDRLFEIKPQRGIYQIDSVCGLDFKLYAADGVDIAYISPNPIESNSIVSINTPVEMMLDLQIVNTLGGIEMNLRNTKLKQGSNEIEIDFSSLANGVYNIMLVKDRIITNRTIIINR